MRDRSPNRGTADFPLPVRRVRIEGAGGGFRVDVPAAEERLVGAGLPRLARVGVADLRRMRPAGLPHWARVWPASVAVAREILRRHARSDASGWPFESVADVGCGVGVAGLAAGHAGSRVVFADRDPDARAFAARNASLAGLERFRCVELDWARPTADAFEALAGCSLVVCADVAYEYRHTAPLAELLERLVRDAGRTVWLVDPFRPTAEDLIRRLDRELPMSVASLSTSWTGRRHELRLVELRPRPRTVPAP